MKLCLEMLENRLVPSTLATTLPILSQGAAALQGLPQASLVRVDHGGAQPSPVSLNQINLAVAGPQQSVSLPPTVPPVPVHHTLPPMPHTMPPVPVPPPHTMPPVPLPPTVPPVPPSHTKPPVLGAGNSFPAAQTIHTMPPVPLPPTVPPPHTMPPVPLPPTVPPVPPSHTKPPVLTGSQTAQQVVQNLDAQLQRLKALLV
jgi:hypothetical protein